MPSIFQASTGKDIKFKEALHRADFDESLMDAVIDDQQLTGDMVNFLREQLKPPAPDLSNLFGKSLFNQLVAIHQWNDEREWGFTQADFDSVDYTPAEHTGLVVDLIVPYLPNQGKNGGIQRTFEELWDIGSFFQLNKWRWDEIKSDKKHLRLLEGIKHEPGIRRVTLDLGANWDPQKGIRPIDVRGPNPAHAEVLAAAAYFPKWVQAMDGVTVPYAWMAGYQLTIPGYEAWRSLPYLFWDSANREVLLSARWGGHRYYYWACPVVRECS